jgi:hypothetical protein
MMINEQDEGMHLHMGYDTMAFDGLFRKQWT